MKRWALRGLIGLGAIVVVLLLAFTAIGGWGLVQTPSPPFDLAQAPPAPDYAARHAWLAFPGSNGLERSAPPGMTAIDERRAPADVFFVHPTTFKGSPVWNAPFDASDEAAPLNPPVLLAQLSAFNGCCRLYAPRYRQATLNALKEPRALDLAYGDIAAAFRHYIAHDNHGRPFIIAAHSQGTAHAIRLLQEEILKTPLQRRLVAAYLIGGYVPDTFGELGLPICAAARQTGCVLSYNSSETGRTGARMITDTRTYWWRGRHVTNGRSRALCVNPLTWSRDGRATAAANPGSLPFPTAPFGDTAKHLTALVPALTGAECRDALLEVTVPWSAPSGFVDKLSILFGSYHLNDYGIFYAALRRNARDRVLAWQQRNDRRPPLPSGGEER